MNKHNKRESEQKKNVIKTNFGVNKNTIDGEQITEFEIRTKEINKISDEHLAYVIDLCAFVDSGIKS